MTRNARLILDIINQSNDHLTADALYLKMKEEGNHISLATVYNNLNKLCDQGLVRRVSVEGQPDRYDHTEKHDHLVCSRCGKLTDYRFPDLTAILHEQSGVDILSYDLQVRYLCPECRAREKETKK